LLAPLPSFSKTTFLPVVRVVVVVEEAEVAALVEAAEADSRAPAVHRQWAVEA
jgi:hypothetical protein